MLTTTQSSNTACHCMRLHVALGPLSPNWKGTWSLPRPPQICREPQQLLCRLRRSLPGFRYCSSCHCAPCQETQLSQWRSGEEDSGCISRTQAQRFTQVERNGKMHLTSLVSVGLTLCNPSVYKYIRGTKLFPHLIYIMDGMWNESYGGEVPWRH